MARLNAYDFATDTTYVFSATAQATPPASVIYASKAHFYNSYLGHNVPRVEPKLNQGVN